MPRRVTSRIHDYFIFEENRSICQLANKEGFICNSPIKGRHAGNLEKHVKTWHDDEWKNYWLEKTNQTDDLMSNKPETHFVNVDFTDLQPEIVECRSVVKTEKKRKTTCNVNETKTPSKMIKLTEIEEAAVELVTVNGFPLTIVEESGFRKLFSLAYKSCDQTIGRQIITRSKLQKLVKTKAELIRVTITDMLRAKLICLRIDCAVVDRRHFYGIAVHLRKSSKLFVFNLAVLNLPSDHTQDILKEEILNVLVEYGVYIHQIYHVLVTNCSQALKTAHKTEDIDDAKVQPSSSDSRDCIDFNDYDSDFDIFEVEETEFDPNEEDVNEIECDDEVKNDEATERLVEEVIQCWSIEGSIITSRDLSHVFQLTILDTFDEDAEINALLKKIRVIVKKLRSPVYLHQLKSFRCKKKPILDSKYRLLSSYDMLLRFKELKPYLDQLSVSTPDIDISLREWNLLMDVVDSLKPLKLTISRLVPKNIPVSEFYKLWITCFLKTKKIGTMFSMRLCKNMDKRKSWLFENKAFKTCLFLDPRFKNTLNSNDHEEVFIHLLEMYDRMIALQPSDPINEDMSIKLENTGNDEDDDLFQYVQAMVKTPVKPVRKTTDIHLALKTFKNSEPLIEIQDVPAFWQEKKYLYAEVYKLSQLVLTVPSCNAYLDVFTSQLKFVLNVNKHNTDARILKDAVLVRSNFNLINQD